MNWNREKRWSIDLWPIQTSWAMLNLLEVIFEVSRKTIQNECSKKWIDLSDYNQVALHIKNKLR